MSGTKSGKVIGISQVKSVPSKDASKQPIQFRQLVLDCTRYDPYTGERSQFEDTPLFEFRGENMKLLDGIQKGDVVTITYDVNGYKYKDAEGKTQIFMSIRPYQLQKREKKQEAPAQNPFIGTTQTGTDDLPF